MFRGACPASDAYVWRRPPVVPFHAHIREGPVVAKLGYGSVLHRNTKAANGSPTWSRQPNCNGCSAHLEAGEADDVTTRERSGMLASSAT